MTDEATHTLYEKRVKHMADQIAQRKIDCVPIMFTSRFCDAMFSRITFEEMNYAGHDLCVGNGPGSARFHVAEVD